MSRFYGVATTKENKSVRVPVESVLKVRAENEAKQYCKENELKLVNLYLLQGSLKQPSTMLKRFTSGKPTPRKRKRK